MMLSVFYDHAKTASSQSDLPIETVLCRFKEAGIDAVELNYEDLTRDMFGIGSALSSAGLSISGLYFTCPFNWNPNIDRAKEAVDLAAALSVPNLLMVPGFIDEDDAPVLHGACACFDETAALLEANSETRNMKKALSELTAYALKQGVRITLEDYDHKLAPYGTIAELSWFLKEVPDLSLTFDTGNFVFFGEDVSLAYEILKKNIVHVHLKDRRATESSAKPQRSDHLSPAVCGQGYLPMLQLLKRLKNDGYQGSLVIEHFGLEDQLNAVLSSAEFVRSVLFETK